VREFEKEDHPKLRTIVARALFNQARGYEEVEEPEEAVRIFTQIVEQFSDDLADPLREVVAASLVNKATRLERLGDIEGALQACSQVWEQFRDADDEKLQKQAYFGLANRTRALTKQSDAQLELAGYEEILAHAAKIKQFGCEEALAMALLNRAEERWHAGQRELALADWRLIGELCGESVDCATQEKVARAFKLKSKALKVLGHFAEEKQTYQWAIESLRELESHAACDMVLWSYCSLGQWLIEEGGDEQGALKVWKEGLSHPKLHCYPDFHEYSKEMLARVSSLEANA
jgi:tetratricopeptide (TPR) repeat protein